MSVLNAVTWQFLSGSLQIFPFSGEERVQSPVMVPLFQLSSRHVQAVKLTFCVRSLKLLRSFSLFASSIRRVGNSLSTGLLTGSFLPHTHARTHTDTHTLFLPDQPTPPHPWRPVRAGDAHQKGHSERSRGAHGEAAVIGGGGGFQTHARDVISQ